jgi:hypothetical protein
MTVRDAKDFLVDQAAQQAAIDGVPLADLEKRMMYFTEWDDSGGDPIALNEEFEAQYNTEEYEAKIAQLMRCARLKKRTPPRSVPGTKLLRNSAKATTIYSCCLTMVRANGNCLALGRASMPARQSRSRDILFPCSRELLIHDQRIDKTVLGVLKRARQTANNLKAEVAPQFHCSVVGADHEVELRGAEAAFPGTLQGV